MYVGGGDFLKLFSFLLSFLSFGFLFKMVIPLPEQVLSYRNWLTTTTTHSNQTKTTKRSYNEAFLSFLSWYFWNSQNYQYTTRKKRFLHLFFSDSPSSSHCQICSTRKLKIKQARKYQNEICFFLWFCLLLHYILFSFHSHKRLWRARAF